MKAKIVNGECVAVMSHREAAFIAAVLGHTVAGVFAEEVDSVCDCLGSIYGYPDNFVKPIQFQTSAEGSFEEHMGNQDIAGHHYA